MTQGRLALSTREEGRDTKWQFCSRGCGAVVKRQKEFTGLLDILLDRKCIWHFRSDLPEQRVAKLDLPLQGILAANGTECAKHFARDVPSKSERRFCVFQPSSLDLCDCALTRKVGKGSRHKMVVDGGGH